MGAVGDNSAAVQDAAAAALRQNARQYVSLLSCASRIHFFANRIFVNSLNPRGSGKIEAIEASDVVTRALCMIVGMLQQFLIAVLRVFGAPRR